MSSPSSLLLPVLLLLLLLSLSLAAPPSLSFRVGQQLSYSLSSAVRPLSSGAPSNAQGSLTGTVEIECTEILEDGDYMFVMNIFNVAVGAGEVLDLPLSAETSLGANMYFQYSPSGNIPNVWYESSDPTYYVDVKLGAINSFQTNVVAATNKQTVLETDVVGKHTSIYDADSSNGLLTLSKTFTQSNMLAFADPSLHQSNLELTARSTALLHGDGYLSQMVVKQNVLLTSLQQGKTDATPSGFDSELGATGQVTMTINSATTALHLTHSPPPPSGEAFSTIPSTYAKSTLVSLAEHNRAKHSETVSAKELEVETTEDLKALLVPARFPLRKLVAHFTASPESLPLFTPILSTPSSSPEDSLVVVHAFAVLSSLHLDEAHAMLVSHGVESDEEWKQFSALASIATGEGCSESLLSSLHSKIPFSSFTASPLSLPQRTAVLALGSFTGRCDAEAQSLMTLMEKVVASEDENLFLLVADAISNANIYHDAPVFTTSTVSPYPRNYTWAKDLHYGGSKLAANFTASAFVGSNLDCKHPNFNYEAYIKSAADVTVFGVTQEAFDAEAIYGRQGPTTVANQLKLTVFGDVIVDRQIPVPSQECIKAKYPIYAFTAPGFSPEYWVWVGPIPVVLDASIHLEFSLDWGYEICESNLTAKVYAEPEAILVASASATTYLLIVEASVSVDGQFDVTVIPTATVSGTACAVTIDAVANVDPMKASVVAEWRRKKCAWWVFDCKWKAWNKDVLWSWEAPSDDIKLFSKTWPIVE